MQAILGMQPHRTGVQREVRADGQMWLDHHVRREIKNRYYTVVVWPEYLTAFLTHSSFLIRRSALFRNSLCELMEADSICAAWVGCLFRPEANVDYLLTPPAALHCSQLRPSPAFPNVSFLTSHLVYQRVLKSYFFLQTSEKNLAVW